MFRRFRSASSRRFALVSALLFIYLCTLTFVMFAEDGDSSKRDSIEKKDEQEIVVEAKEYSLCSTDPFVTGDGFRSSCHLIFDDKLKKQEQQNFLNLLFGTMKTQKAIKRLNSPLEVMVPVVISVFVQTHLMDKFIEYCLKKVERSSLDWQLVLVSHNSDVSAPFNRRNLRNKNNDRFYDYQIYWVLDNPRVLAWYSTNTAIEHPKLWPIPIGIENNYNPYGRHIDVYRESFHHVRSRNDTRDGDNNKKLLLIAFGLSSYHAYRSEVLRVVKKAFEGYSSNITLVERKKGKGVKVTARDVQSYLYLLSQHRFVLAPRGNGMDTHRLWEALYMGSVPIVERSTMDSRLLSGLPVLLVDNFADVTPSLLNSSQALALTARERFTKVDNTILCMTYWRQIIMAHKTPK
ncbi:hypothetical protein LSM04_004785 [Trypanosoma melophagium]|uniref:uncharacterized protein n=1 Tax=Trypanosoma melophagium TaxID=715481 RepID=UPI00351A6FD9|nr:hypothetical protein LSM04_004785 [Trypanosoma melophagium]